ncbi:heterokaryon incompatibility protein (HET) domain-containing protein [Trichoderma breve]|uniref:Heterokaryon incompatibility protein (HET) domain-containing protein n=1 Tax=Trichoderma breve TaxID=2034170 RepID=A0A9W9EB37_9HYPO|nr:heterokaryon incompatibility protein (HET) domain-containing protein [Trichoderma breve]KAJ4863403.1 heterokaryon incompatibility protein (HET) domain-containing protein [Trichoderma breve]
MFNKEYLHALKISHEDLSELLPDIEALDRLVQPKGSDDNGRAGGSVIALLREPSDINVSSTSTASDETFAKIGDWIHRCEQDHTQCTRFRSQVPWYPTRLLDVGPEGNSSFALVHSAQAIDKDEKYMTLSHRWGDAKVPTLTTKTIINWAQGLSVKILPKTFQDFIMLAQRLQIRYVWIDSLCIIQEGDNGKDWRTEALTMDKVYMNSYCNVSADWGSPKRGLEPNRDVVVAEECLLVENEFWEDQVSRSPLSVRGWVVQERWLCPRNLRFGPREVFFECEPLLEGDVILKSAFSNLQTLQSPQAALLPATLRTELYTAWGEILSKYSRCYLTYASDRTVAFSGIAKFFRSLVDDNYIAGLWLRNLASDMMWFRHRLLTTAVVEDTKDRLSLFNNNKGGVYRAPSFSWASTAVPIALNHMEDNMGFIISVRCIHFRDSSNATIEDWTGDIFGPLSTPMVEILVVGTLKKMRLQPYFDGEMTDFYVVPDSPSGSSKKTDDWSEPISKETAEATLDFQVNNEDVAAWAAQDNLYYIPWQDCWNSHLPPKSKRDSDSLTCLLVELADVSMNRFRRIGRLYVHDKSKRKLYIAKQSNESTLPSEHYDPTTRRHTIYLI